MNITRTFASVAIALAAIAGIGAPIASAEPLDKYAFEVGDDDGNGVIDEDESGWSCVDMGNKVCGPGNSNGAPAGRYDEGGVLVEPWSQLITHCKDICLGA